MMEGFYLAGGTAVALYMGHRRSYDLDWFLPTSLDEPLGLARRIGELFPFVVDRIDRGTLHGTAEGVRLSFLEYRYPLLRRLKSFPEGPCRLASLEDLACMKLAAVSQRGSRKDFLDLLVLTRKFPLKKMLPWYLKKYPVQTIAPVLYGMVYFDEADHEPQPRMLEKISWVEARRRLQSLVAAVYSDK